MNRIALILISTAALIGAQTKKPGYTDTPMLPGGKWVVHDSRRPTPPVVTPGAKPGDPPSDAIVLFDGTNLNAWNGFLKGQTVPAGWKVRDGYVEVDPAAGSIQTKENFGDIQLHLEWASPSAVKGSDQLRGNSGIEIMGRYEVQVLDSYENPTYADGQAGAIYGQVPPMVNAVRKPGEWQTYDLVFEAPRWQGAVLTKPARLTLFHNGVLVQNAEQWIGQVAHRAIKQYEPHQPELPLRLQNHGDLVRYRNIWVRRLTPYENR